MSTHPAFAAPRVQPNAAHAFGGVWRLTVQRLFTLTHWLVVAGMLVLLVLFSIPATPTPAAATKALLPWASRFYVCFLVPILSFMTAAGVMRDDLRADSVDYIFTRPISRWRFLLFRFVSHVACTQLDFLVAFAVVVGIGVYWNVPGWWDAVPLMLLAQVLAIVAFSAFGFFGGMLTGRYVIVGLLYAGVVEAGIGNVPTQLNQLSMVRHLLNLMRPIVGEGEMGMTAALAENAPGTAGTLAALLGFVAVSLAAAIALFSFKELATSGGRET